METDSAALQAEEQRSLVLFLMMLSYWLMIGGIASGIGILMGKAWGFIAGIILATLDISDNLVSILTPPAQMKLAVEVWQQEFGYEQLPAWFADSVAGVIYVFLGLFILLHVLLLIFCIFRLAGRAGPKPL